MKLNFKYIIVDSGAILFNEQTTHAVVAQGFRDLKQEIYAAGFVCIEFNNNNSKLGSPIGGIRCHGKSESLKIESQPEIDQIIISDLFRPISQIKYLGMQVKPFYKE